MKKLIASLILASFICGIPALAQTEEDEVRLLIARAPVTQAVAKAEGEEALAVWNWLMALAYTGHTKEAFLAATKIRKWMNEGESNTAIALGLAIAGRVDEAISLLRRTKAPSAQILVVEILAKDGRISEALDVARNVENANDRNSCLQAVAEELASRGEARRALAAVSEVTDKRSLNDALRGVMKELLRAGKIGEARSVAERIQSDRTEQSPLQSAIFELAADTATEGAPEAALQMIEMIEDEAKRAWPLSLIAEAFAKAGNLDEAVKTARKINDESLLPTALADVAVGFAGKGEKIAARNLLNEAIGLAQQIDGKKNQEGLICSLISNLAKSGLVSEALTLADSLADRIKPGFEQSDAIDSIAKALAEAGKTKEALDLLRSYGKRISFPHNSAVTIVEKLARSGKMNEVFAIGNDIPFPAAVNQAVVEGLLKAGKIDDALTVAQNIEDENDRSEAFAEAAEFLLQSGSYKQARLVADHCPSPVLRMFIYWEIFNELALQRNPQLRTQLKNYHLRNAP